MTKYLLGVFERDADAEEIVQAARTALLRLGIEPKAAEGEPAQDQPGAME